MKNKKYIGITAIIMTTAILFNFSVAPTYAAAKKTTSSKSANQLYKERDTYKNKIDQMKKQISEIDKKTKTAKNTKEDYDDEAQRLQNKSDLLEQQMNLIQSNIDAKQKSIDALQADIDRNTKLYKERMRANYMTGDTSYMEIILGAKNLYDFVAKYEIVQSIQKHDNDLIIRLKNDKAQMDSEKAEMVQNQKDKNSTKSQIDKNQDDIEKLSNQTQTYINKLANDSEQAKKDLQDYQNALQKTESLIDQIQSTNPNGIVTKDFLWPVPNYYTITSPFGPRPSMHDFHKGIDISGANVLGKNIVATKAGVVKAMPYSANGYGNYVMVLHDDGSATLYGHCTSIKVSNNQRVSKGQVIATVGSTGRSTGPHLHYEIRIPVNGKLTAVNPMNYYSKK